MEELDLDGVKCLGEIDFGDLQMDNLEAVTLSRANLTSLKNFPTLPSLVKVWHYYNIESFNPYFFTAGSLPQQIV